MASTAPQAPPIISLRQVHKGYASGSFRVDALQGVDLDVLPSEILALTGPSGSGKSTLLNVCGLIDRPDAGACLVDGVDASQLDDQSTTLVRRKTIGFVFQSFNLVPVMTAADNVDYPLFLLGVEPRERAQRVADMLSQVGLNGLGKQLPGQLSGGQRQRVAIARALIKRPRLVIADEPTANLDTQTAEQVVALMRDLGRLHRTTFLIATHDLRMVRGSDRVVHLADGMLR